MKTKNINICSFRNKYIAQMCITTCDTLWFGKWCLSNRHHLYLMVNDGERR